MMVRIGVLLFFLNGLGACEKNNFKGSTGSEPVPLKGDANVECETRRVDTTQPIEHFLLNKFATTFTAAKLPTTVEEVKKIVAAPLSIEGASLKNLDSKTGDEFIDINTGGVTAANINLGLAAVRESVKLLVPKDAKRVDTKELDAVVEAKRGWRWGSIVYESTVGVLYELVYLYFGYLNQGGDGDIEFSLISETAHQVAADECAPTAK